eukprot:comp8962_c0_seq1/m.4160 comp8962_c0_seq1/g.4160  ORF comp8962_c0_seq1/g.4160 comp8962_c0_seq1/m.4160 type:complete len:129 (-) comp8962_c0_seq1:205-591(-)
MSSWQAYVDSNLVGTGCVSKAAIHGHDGSVWATSSDLSVSPAEVVALVNATTNPTPLYSGGIHLAGQKYQFLRAEEGRSLYGKLGENGCVIVKTNQAIVIGIYEKPLPAGNCTLTVEKLADYLIENGY